VACPEERKFPGVQHISIDGSERRIAPKALDKFEVQIRDRPAGYGRRATMPISLHGASTHMGD
jgi:hypothetical protein